MELFGIGWMEMLIIGLVALIVVGPERLPQAAQTVGRMIGYVSRQWQNIQKEIRQPVENELRDIQNNVVETIHDVTDLEPVVKKRDRDKPGIE
ncbi:MAG: Sec-independent protein translocase protein TatB [Mariprofundales bacterium]|nr:Sec-independent protein translocase protein TatB [Mariprofundales bacterium]